MSKHIYSLYKTTNLINNKIYYGVHKETLWPDLDGYLGSGIAVNEAIKKYGKENFKREVLCISDKKEYVFFLESKIVNKTFIKESTNYNICGGGRGPLIYSDEMRKKLSDANKDKNNSMYGKTHSLEIKREMSKRFKGKNNPNYGKVGAMLGKKHTKETIKKILEIKKGYKHSEETKQKIGAKSKGRIPSEETKKKMSNAQKERWRKRKESTDLLNNEP